MILSRSGCYLSLRHFFPDIFATITLIHKQIIAMTGYYACGAFIFIIFDRHSGSVVERPLCDREVAGSIPCRVIPKTLKMVLAALSLGAQH